MDTQAKIIPLQLHPLGFIEAFTRLGADLDALLGCTGISQASLGLAGAKISYAEQALLLRNGIELCRRPGLGLLIGMSFDWSFYGTVGGVVDCSPTLHQAGVAFRRYGVVAQPYDSHLERQPHGYIDEDGRFIYSLPCFPPGGRSAEATLFETEFRLASTLRVWDACGNKDIPDPSVHVVLGYAPPPHADLYRRLLPCASLQFDGMRTYLAAHQSFFSEPFRPLRKVRFDRIIARCEQELAEAHLDTTLATRIRWHIYAHFNKQVTLEQTAEDLLMTPRALTRRLAAEHTSFREIVHNVRMELTSHHLKSSGLSVEALAKLMGFSSPSCLRRAVRNWSADMPSAAQLLPKISNSRGARIMSR